MGGLLNDTTTAHIVLVLRSLIWGFGENCTIAHCVTFFTTSECILKCALLQNVRFADDIDLLGSNEDELQQLAHRFEETAAEYGMEINSD